MNAVSTSSVNIIFRFFTKSKLFLASAQKQLRLDVGMIA